MADDFSKLREMKYSGRALHRIVTIEDYYGVGYTLTGRSSPSQARRLKVGEKTGTIRVEAVTDDESLKRMFKINTVEELAKLKDEIAKGSPALIYYPAIRPVKKENGDVTGIVASNGIQTDLIYSKFINLGAHGYTNPLDILESAFDEPYIMYDPQYDRDIDVTSFEPDDPNFTSRINICLNLKYPNPFSFMSFSFMSISLGPDLSKTPHCERGTVLSLPTYLGGNEKPRLLPFSGDLIESRMSYIMARDICKCLYEAIGKPNPDDNNKVYRVAAAVMMVKPSGLETFVINRADRGE
ncbi:MAG: hypothetical protein Q8N99_07345 [Nanoarchaeota archaeon]|nr:hypothetical protein [Nanoarchaeota archaeon]